MSILSKEQILGAVDIKTETVEVPEWGGSVLVKGMTGAEENIWEEFMYKNNEGKDKKTASRNVTVALCAFSIVDENGKRIFSETDIELLGQKSSAALNRVFKVARKLSKIFQSDLDELVKNSVAAQGGASGSD